MNQPRVQSLHHAASGTWSHLVSDEATGTGLLIDPVLDFDAASGRTRTDSAQALLDLASGVGARIEWILETHAHADHLSAAAWLKSRTGARTAIGAGICDVQRHFKVVFNAGEEFATDGSQFDRLLVDGECLDAGGLQCRVIATPGHTSDSVSYLVGDALFVGDTVFMPNAGTARCDFPGGDAATLFHSVRRLYELPGETRVFVCHDYPAAGSTARAQCTLAEQRAGNIHVDEATPEARFVAMRNARDATLAVPALVLPAVQVNMRAGELPPAEENGTQYLKIPLNLGLGH